MQCSPFHLWPLKFVSEPWPVSLPYGLELPMVDPEEVNGFILATAGFLHT